MLNLIPRTLTSAFDLIPQFVRPHSLASIHLMQTKCFCVTTYAVTTYAVTTYAVTTYAVFVLIILAYTWVIFIVVSVIVTYCVFKLGKEECIKLDFLSLTPWSVKLGSDREAD